MDTLTPRQRSECMRSVRSANTSPELIVRRLVHSMAFRYSLHSASLPGKPDIVLNSRRKIIFVHGCFWHKHRCRRGSRVPITNRSYWEEKRDGNARRDRAQIAALRKDGWQVMVAWECWTRQPSRLRAKLESFLAVSGGDAEKPIL